jgi:hypothetical protein
MNYDGMAMLRMERYGVNVLCTLAVGVGFLVVHSFGINRPNELSTLFCRRKLHQHGHQVGVLPSITAGGIEPRSYRLILFFSADMFRTYLGCKFGRMRRLKTRVC